MKRHIPNFLTSCNLFCGCIGIHLAFEGELVIAAGFALIGALFDFSDGFAARMLKVSSPMGKELDSLADMVSFGILPASVMFMMIKNTNPQFELLPYAGFIIAVFSGLRLAAFNIDTRQSDSFIGLPTPANALFILSLPVISEQYDYVASWLSNPWLLLGISLLMSVLLVAELPLFALKFKSFSFPENKVRYTFLLVAGLLLVLLQVLAVPFIILLYVLLSLVFPDKEKTLENPSK